MTQSTVEGVTLIDNAAVKVWRAKAGHICRQCSRKIERGRLFTRRMMAGGGSVTFPICRTCRPFGEVLPQKPSKAKGKQFLTCCGCGHKVREDMVRLIPVPFRPIYRHQRGWRAAEPQPANSPLCGRCGVIPSEFEDWEAWRKAGAPRLEY